MWRLSLQTVGDREALLAELWELGTLGVTELDDGLHAFFTARFDAGRFSAFGPVWEDEPDRDWAAASLAGWEPLEVGKRLFLVPEWRDDPAPVGRLRLTVHAGAASGSGYSIPTQLALAALEQRLRRSDTVLDVGTGSGILSAAAILLGAGKAVACDMEPDSAIQARLHVPQALVFAGSPRSLRDSVADLIVANINAVALISIAGELARVAKSPARVIVCGFHKRRLEAVQSALAGHGLTGFRQMEREGWLCLLS